MPKEHSPKLTIYFRTYTYTNQTQGHRWRDQLKAGEGSSETRRRPGAFTGKSIDVGQKVKSFSLLDHLNFFCEIEARNVLKAWGKWRLRRFAWLECHQGIREKIEKEQAKFLVFLLCYHCSTGLRTKFLFLVKLCHV